MTGMDSDSSRVRQDSESIGGTTVVFGMADSIESLKRQVASRFLYDNVVLYSQHGARIDDLSMIPPDEVILATDGKPFPAETRVLFTSGAGELRSLPAMSSERSMNTAESQGRVAHGCHGGAQDTPSAMRSMLVEDLWGWRKIGQLVGGREARTKALTSWRNSGTAASIVFAIEFLAFLHPPTPVGRSGLDTDSWNDEPGVESALRTYFWFSALGMTLGLFALLTATMMSMQLNMMAYEADVMWFFELYGNTLFGWPTTLLILSIICLAGTVVSSAFITYPLHSDAVAFLCLVCVGCVLSLSMFVTFSTRSWARINTTNARVWPVGDRTPPGSPRVTSGGSALYREQSRRAFGRQPSVGTIVTATSAHINGRSFTSSLEGGRSMSVRTAERLGLESKRGSIAEADRLNDHGRRFSGRESLISGSQHDRDWPN